MDAAPGGGAGRGLRPCDPVAGAAAAIRRRPAVARRPLLQYSAPLETAAARALAGHDHARLARQPILGARLLSVATGP